MFRNMFLIIQREITATLRRVTLIIFMFGVPIVMGIVAIIAYQINKTAPNTPNVSNGGVSSESEAVPIGLVGPSKLVGAIPPWIKSVRYKQYINQADALADLRAKKISGFFVVPNGYAEGEEPEYFSLNTNPLSNSVNTYEFGNILAYNLLKDDPQAADLAFNTVDLKVTQLAVAQSVSNSTDSNNWYVSTLPTFMVILLYMAILVPAGNLVSGLTDEKKNRVMEVLLCSISPMQLFVGKLLATGLLGLIQMLLWIGVLWGVGKFGGQPLQVPEGYSVPTDLLLWSVVFAVLGYMMYAAQLAGVGAISPTLSESRSVTFLLMLPLIIGYSYSTVISRVPFSPLAYFFSYFPLTAPVAMIGRMAAVPLPFWEPLLSSICQLIGVLIIVRLFGRLFHASLMLSGQPLNVRRLFRALQGKA